jgi:hypothetical protein
MALKTVYLQLIIIQNAKTRFRGAGLIPFDSQVIL